MIRFFNGKVLLFDPEPRLTDDEVWTDGERIVHVGQFSTSGDDIYFSREINLHGDILIPGFKNAHAHTAMVFLRSIADGKPLQRWLEEDIWPNEAKMTDDDVYWFTRLGIMEYLSTGITSAFDMYYHNDACFEAIKDSGFRMVICSSMNDFDKDITNIEREFRKFNSCGSLVSYALGIHAEYTTCPERIEYMAFLAEKYKAPCFTHLSETRSEVAGCIERHGMTPPQYLDSMGLFRYGGGGFHCIHFTPEDIELFARNGLHAVTCPASNLKLASGIAPLAKLLAAGIPLSIGTDGASSNNALDFFREMYLAAVLQNIKEDHAAAFPAGEILKMACVNGAKAMGLTYCDGIAPGRKADLAVLSMVRPNMQPRLNDISNIVYSGSRDNVRLTMVNGRILYEDGVFFTGEDQERVYREVQSRADRIIGR